jgi:diaminopimelate epimerase
VVAIPFLKMHGCGNDFIVVNDADGRLTWDILAELSRRFCPRRLSVGADGVIAVGHTPLPGEQWPAPADYEMRYVNADGSRAEMCGNGIRCLGKFAADELGDRRDDLRIATGGGVLPIQLHRDSGGRVATVTVGMGVPRLLAQDIPTTLRPPGEAVVGALLEADDDEPLAVTCVNMGNPHAVAFVDAITEHHVHGLGPLIETHPAFPERANAEFVQVLAADRLRMRVWERGCGETWACGTGACASVVAAVLNSHSRHGESVTVVLNGGELSITWPAPDAEVQMTGPAVTVFRGELML